jgi:hypothetical protein
MVYNKEYYQKNRDKLLNYQKEWKRKHYKGLDKDNPLRIRSLKAWRTRRNATKNI